MNYKHKRVSRDNDDWLSFSRIWQQRLKSGADVLSIPPETLPVMKSFPD